MQSDSASVYPGKEEPLLCAKALGGGGDTEMREGQMKPGLSRRQARGQRPWV